LILKYFISRCQWSEAIFKFLPSIPVHYVHHFANTRDCIKDDKITIITYDLLVRARNIFQKYIYGFVILVHTYFFSEYKLITNAKLLLFHFDVNCRMNLIA